MNRSIYGYVLRAWHTDFSITMSRTSLNTKKIKVYSSKKSYLTQNKIVIEVVKESITYLTVENTTIL